jgi:hypothetical protein
MTKLQGGTEGSIDLHIEHTCTNCGSSICPNLFSLLSSTNTARYVGSELQYSYERELVGFLVDMSDAMIVRYGRWRQTT